MACAGGKGTMHSICSTPELSERREMFAMGLKLWVYILLGEIQQAGASEIAGKSVTPCSTLVSDYKRLDTMSYFIITNFHTDLKPQENVTHDMISPTFALYTQP